MSNGLSWLVHVAACYPLNQWLVRRKNLDHRPYFVPSLWGLVGTLIILLAQPRGWRKYPSKSQRATPTATGRSSSQ